MSDGVKDLLRSLLQSDPQHRIDWEDFFNHSVFGNEGLHKKHSEEINGEVVNTKKLDLEFEKNKEQIKAIDKTGPCLDPEEMKIEKNADQVTENSFSMSGSSPEHIGSKVSHFREYAFRYYHEKNKIMMIYLTVKKLRQLMKEKEFASHASNIYLLLNFLAKKGSILSELTLMSLSMKQNIFKLQYFDEFCGSAEYHEVIKTISDDQRSVFEYRDYITSLRKDISLSEEEKKLLQLISKGYVDFKFLDDQSKKIYMQVRDFDSTAVSLNNEQLRHFYYLTMIFSIYSIRSETYMPYLVDNHKFEWDTFREKHENICSDDLRQHLAAIPMDF